MRTLITITIIVALLLGGSIASYRYIQATTQSLGTQLTAIEQSASAQKWETAQQALTTTQQNLAQAKTWWTILLNHQDIDTVEIGLNRLQQYLKTQNASLALGELSTLRLQVENIHESEKLNLKNIF